MAEHGWLFAGVFKYKDKEYTIHYDFGKDYNKESAEFMFLEGNYSCDCNRSLIIQSEYGENAIPDLDCGEEIKLLSYRVYEPKERVGRSERI